MLIIHRGPTEEKTQACMQDLRDAFSSVESLFSKSLFCCGKPVSGSRHSSLYCLLRATRPRTEISWWRGLPTHIQPFAAACSKFALTFCPRGVLNSSFTEGTQTLEIITIHLQELSSSLEKALIHGQSTDLLVSILFTFPEAMELAVLLLNAEHHDIAFSCLSLCLACLSKC